MVAVSTVVAFTAAVSAPRPCSTAAVMAAIARFHYGGYRHAYYRPHFYHRPHFRRFYGAGYYPAYYGYPHRYCRVVWTYYGPRKICRYRPWHYRHHYRHHHWHHYRYW